MNILLNFTEYFANLLNSFNFAVKLSSNSILNYLAIQLIIKTYLPSKCQKNIFQILIN